MPGVRSWAPEMIFKLILNSYQPIYKTKILQIHSISVSQILACPTLHKDTAFDSNMNRLKKFSRGMSRLKVDNVDAEMADMTVKKVTRSSKMLVDAPCTGTGVMSKRADLRWSKSYNDILEISPDM